MNELINRLLGCRAVLFLLKIFSPYLTGEFPIWWYVAPSIINTFLESYDFTGKRIIPFATSGGSGMGKTNQKLHSSCAGAILMDGKVLSSRESRDSLAAWVDGINL